VILGIATKGGEKPPSATMLKKLSEALLSQRYKWFGNTYEIVRVYWNRDRSKGASGQHSTKGHHGGKDDEREYKIQRKVSPQIMNLFPRS
jgi:hypothetical protein